MALQNPGEWLPGGEAKEQLMSSPAVAVQFSEAEMRLLQTLIYQECGMYFDARRAHFLQDRLQRRLRECRLDSFYSYYRLLLSEKGKQELAQLLENLTVNETSFFRNKAQLDLFHKHLLEEIIRKKQSAGDNYIRIWSAGCSTGQEPYTVAMLVADALSYHELRMPHPANTTWPKPLVPPPWRVEIPASDISYSVLRAGQEGIYSESQMASVDYNYRLRYFDKVGERYAVKKAVKELVHFDFHNLKTEFLPQRNDVIFCRNVMMYFDEAEQKRLIEKFHRCLVPGGYLLVGHAESLLGLTDKFTMVYRHSGTAYRRNEVAE
jgi:chemotaxis protein methyltransferase CheR